MGFHICPVICGIKKEIKLYILSNVGLFGSWNAKLEAHVKVRL